MRTAFNTLLISALLSLSSLPGTMAAECYSSSGCQCGECESEDSMWTAREDMCGSNKWMSNFAESWGWAEITLLGRFDSQQSCWNGFANIIDQCYGHENGGVYNWDFGGFSAKLDVNFCECR